MIADLQPVFYILGGVTLLLVFMLVVLTESVVFQLLHWDDLRKSWKAVLIINAVSAILTSPLLAMAPAWGLLSLVAAWGFSMLIEGLILNRINPDEPRLNWLCVMLANIASYLILIYPSFRYASHVSG